MSSFYAHLSRAIQWMQMATIFAGRFRFGTSEYGVDNWMATNLQLIVKVEEEDDLLFFKGETKCSA
jgi:hypothetical protein